MEMLNVLAFIGAWLLLGILANRFGHDSRDGLVDPPSGPIWRLPADPPPIPASWRQARVGIAGWPGRERQSPRVPGAAPAALSRHRESPARPRPVSS